MKIMLALAMTVSFAVALACPAYADTYVPGFVWDRTGDYEWGPPDSDNPNKDIGGNPVWAYESVTGDGIGGANPWYQNTGPLMVWNTSRWARTATSPFPDPWIDRGYLYHGTDIEARWEYSPLVRWTNPAPVPLTIQVIGDVMIGWQANQVPVDVAVARVGTGALLKIVETTLNAPGPVTIPIDTILDIDPGDSIIFAIRAQQAADKSGAMVYMYDNPSPPTWPGYPEDYNEGVQIRLLAAIPEPSTMALLAIGGTAAVLRRRRRR